MRAANEMRVELLARLKSLVRAPASSAFDPIAKALFVLLLAPFAALWWPDSIRPSSDMLFPNGFSSASWLAVPFVPLLDGDPLLFVSSPVLFAGQPFDVFTFIFFAFTCLLSIGLRRFFERRFENQTCSELYG